MSISIIKAGVYDTVQDSGRQGYRSTGVNPGGVMDYFSAAVANALVGNATDAPVIECHFPAATIVMEQDTMIALGGADFSPLLNGVPIPLCKPVIAVAGSVLEHAGVKSGASCYIAFREGLDIPMWLNSYSTNIKAGAGGWQGRVLQKNDRIGLREKNHYDLSAGGAGHKVLAWQADIDWGDINSRDEICVLPGPEYGWLDDEAKSALQTQVFTVSNTADRMGYQLQEELPYRASKELLSSGTTFGTVQLLPGGKIIVLMADHQVSGGYPRIAQVITAHLPLLAQKRPGDMIRFRNVTQNQAEELLLKQQQHLLLLQHACRFKLDAVKHIL